MDVHLDLDSYIDRYTAVLCCAGRFVIKCPGPRQNWRAGTYLDHEWPAPDRGGLVQSKDWPASRLMQGGAAQWSNVPTSRPLLLAMPIGHPPFLTIPCTQGISQHPRSRLTHTSSLFLMTKHSCNDAVHSPL